MGCKRVEGWDGGTVVVVDNIIGCHGNCIGIYKLRQYNNIFVIIVQPLVSVVTAHLSCSAQ